MADSIPSINSDPAPAQTAQVLPSSQNAATAEASASANGTKKDYDMETQISSVADLREKAPEVWDKMMQGLAQTMISEMRERQERLKKMQREGREA